MATRIVNKLYDYNNNLLATKTSTCRGYTYLVNEVRTTFETILLESVKRPTKNLESLIKALNKQGYTVSLSQIIDSHDNFVWGCFIHDQTRQENTVVYHSTHYHKTAYQALKEALPKYGWFKLEV